MEQSTHDTFTLHGRKHILVVPITHPKHPWHVCGVGKFVGINQFFGPLSSYHNKAHVIEEVLRSMRE